jgi:hypothetical protein
MQQMRKRTAVIRGIQRNAEQNFLSDASGFSPVDQRKRLQEEDLLRAARDKSDPFTPDSQFAGLVTDTGSIAASNLHRFLGNLDEEAVREAARASGDSQLLEEYQQEHNESVVHLAGHEARVRKHGAQWIAVVNAGEGTQPFKALTRDALMEKLVTFCRALAAEEKRFATRELTESERLECIRYAQQGLVQDCMSRYLYYAFSGREIDWFTIIDDPRYREVCDAACTLAWIHSRDAYSPTPERNEYIQRFCAGRPLTISLLDAAWKACQEAEGRTRDANGNGSGGPERNANAPEPEESPTYRELDELSDEAVESQLRGAKKEYSRLVRAGVL